MTGLYCLLLLCAVNAVVFKLDFFGRISRRSTSNDDRVEQLPGLSVQPNFAQYSGYLQGLSNNYQLHYWLVEATKNPETAPLVLWLNGGPGCSSMEGLLSENGPFIVQEGVRLKYNPYSWNKFANMLYLEAPAGVGYSFAVDNNVTTDDDLTSMNNYHALLNFLEKFPAYRNRDFYITGESYGGVYVPTLALRVLQNKPNDLNLKGIAVGNPLTSYRLNDNSLLYFLNYHGLIDESQWNDLLSNCCGSQCASKCMFTDGKSIPCQMSTDSLLMLTSGLDIYNLYKPCAGGVLNNSILKGVSAHHSSFRPDWNNLFRGNPVRIVLNNKQPDSNRFKIKCTDDTNIYDYMNAPEVRHALHADPRAPSVWDICSAEVEKNYHRTYSDMSQAYLNVLNFSIPVLMYAGDIDMACNFLGLLWFVDNLELPLDRPMSSWLYDAADGTKQIGGFRKVLRSGNTPLWYVTVRGAGHMVPEDKPDASYHMITKFLLNQHL